MKRLFISILLFTVQASANEKWERSNLRSDNGTEIKIDYQIKNARRCFGHYCSSVYYAAPINVTVFGENINAADKITATITNACSDERSNTFETYAAYLDNMENYFFSTIFEDYEQIGDILPTKMRIYIPGRYPTYCNQTLEIRVNGTPLIDPINGESYFRLDLGHTL